MELFQTTSLEELVRIAREVRCNIIRMITQAQAGHPGGALSVVDILISLYFEIMRVDATNPTWEDRDRFVLSKGHASVALYAVLAERGFFPKEELMTFDHINSRLQGHVDMLKTPGIDMSTGSMGQGLSAAVGMALGAKLDSKHYRTYVILGDGEVQEGQVWEAVMFAANRGLDNLTAILDFNKVQLYGTLSEIMPIEPVLSKFQTFGWNTIEIDGHDIQQTVGSLRRAAMVIGKPTMIIAHTVKGKNVSFMEGKALWHARPTTQEECELALSELKAR
jgi:transketolase